jgi:hypothetical protein
MLRRALSLVVDVVAAAADEAAPGWSQTGAGYRWRESSLAQRGDGVAEGDRASLARDKIDAEVSVAKGCPQRAGNVEIALAGDRIDVRRVAAAILSSRRQPAGNPHTHAKLLAGRGQA